MSDFSIIFLMSILALSVSADVLNGSKLDIVDYIILVIFAVLSIGAIDTRIVDAILSSRIQKHKKLYYSADMLRDKNIRNSEFLIEAKFEKDKKLFQNLYDSSLYRVSLPREDYTCFDFSDVLLARACFTEESIIPDDSDLFQNIKYKSLTGTVLPEKDFRKYNFNGVSLINAKFTKNSRLSDKNDFFQNIKGKSLGNIVLPSYETRNFHLFKLNYIKIDDSFLTANSFSRYQLLIAYNKDINDKNKIFKLDLF